MTVTVNEDPTKELPGASPFEQRVLTELAAIRSEVSEIRIQQMAMVKNIVALDQRLTSLEKRVDSRLKETRPIWEAVQAQIEKLDEKFNIFIRDLYDVRGDLGLHDKRLGLLERRVLS
jgi:predicted  nucleic acid-binding Zn-ribbon protein